MSPSGATCLIAGDAGSPLTFHCLTIAPAVSSSLGVTSAGPVKAVSGTFVLRILPAEPAAKSNTVFLLYLTMLPTLRSITAFKVAKPGALLSLDGLCTALSNAAATSTHLHGDHPRFLPFATNAAPGSLSFKLSCPPDFAGTICPSTALSGLAESLGLRVICL